MSFGIAHNPHSIAIHSSVIVHSGRAVLFWVSRNRKEHPYAPVARTHSRCATAQRRFADRARRRRRADRLRVAVERENTLLPQRELPHRRIRAIGPGSRTTGSPDWPVVRAIGALLPSCPPAFAYDAQLQDNICDTLSQQIARVPVYQLECLPDADAARLSFETTIADR